MRKVLFVCVGNCCRSQMAEGFARAYGADVLQAESAGLCPTPEVAPETVQCMAEKNIDITAQFPKLYDPRATAPTDLIINLSGGRLPGKTQAEIRDWNVEDPFLRSPRIYRRSRQEIENRVNQLILELRR